MGSELLDELADIISEHKVPAYGGCQLIGQAAGYELAHEIIAVIGERHKPQPDAVSVWLPIESLPEKTMAWLYSPYEPHYCAGSYVDEVYIEQEIISDTPERTTYRKVQKTERKWEADNRGATHWMPLPTPPLNAAEEG